LETAYARTAQQFHPSPARLVAYYDLVFDGVPLSSQRLLDVGGGSGVASFYAASRGAAVTCLEPAGDGAAGNLPVILRRFQEAMPDADVRLDQRTLQQMRDDEGPFDIVLLHNSVNHLNEAACAHVHKDAEAREAYLTVLAKLAALTAHGGFLIVADCGRRNLLGSLGMPNPFAPGIDWHIHQQPRTWVRLLRDLGFAEPRVRWDAPSRMRRWGQSLFGNPVGGWLLNSHFIITMRRAD
jgi:SAM-dependent methyltransferase